MCLIKARQQWCWLAVVVILLVFGVCHGVGVLILIFLLIIGRLMTMRQPQLVMMTLISVMVYTPLLWQSHQSLIAPTVEQRRIVTVIPHWATMRRYEGGYQVEGVWRHQRVMVQVMSDKAPNTQRGLTGEAIISNGKQARVPYGFCQRLWLKSRHLSGSLSMKHPNATPIHQPLLWRLQMRVHTYLQRFPTFIRTYGQMLCLGLAFENKEAGQAYQDLGLMHLFCLSGLHVHLVIGFWRYILCRLNMTRRSVVIVEAVVIVLMYVWFNGGIGIFRSGVMRLYRDSLTEAGSSATGEEAWSVALLLQTLCFPYVLMSSSGLLSYAMSFFAIYFYRHIRPLWKRTLLYTLWTLPVIVYVFKQWHFLTPLLNLIAMPLFSYVLFPLVLMVIFCPLPILVSLVEALCVLVDTIIQWLAHLVPMELAPFNIVCLLLYGVLLWLLFMTKRYTKLSILLCLLFLLNEWHPMGEVTMVDVGQGDSLFIRPAGVFQHASLVDCGGKVFSRSRQKNATYTLLPFLKGKGVRVLDYFFITHADSDHMGDMLEVAKHCRIRHLCYSAGCEKKPLFNKKLQYMKQLQPAMKCHAVLAPKQWTEHGIQWKVLAPRKVGDGQNNDSLVMEVTAHQRRFLLTGDLEKEGEAALLNDLRHVDVLKVGHHGSKTATSEAFLQKIQPKQAWISCGVRNRFGHPHQEVTHRLQQYHIPMYRTDEDGTISYYFTIGYEKIMPMHQKDRIIKDDKT